MRRQMPSQAVTYRVRKIRYNDNGLSHRLWCTAYLSATYKSGSSESQDTRLVESASSFPPAPAETRMTMDLASSLSVQVVPSCSSDCAGDCGWCEKRLRLDGPREMNVTSSLAVLLLPSTDPFLLRRMDFDLARSFPSALSAIINVGCDTTSAGSSQPPKTFLLDCGPGAWISWCLCCWRCRRWRCQIRATRDQGNG